MKISVLIPAYNCQETIYSCIRSIMKQTYKDFEIIVVDDGSTDGTSIRLDQYEKHYNQSLRIIHASHQGVSAARNRCLKEAKGEYIFFMDSDDWISPDTLECMIELGEKSKAEVVICGHDLQGVFGIKNCVHAQISPNRREVLRLLLKDREVKNYAWGKLIKKECWQGIEFPVNKVFEDTATVHKVLIKSKKTIIIPSILYHYNLNSRSSITYGLNPDILNEMMEACVIQANNILEIDPTLRKEVNKMMTRNKSIAIASLLKSFRYDKKLMKQILSYHPQKERFEETKLHQEILNKSH